MNDQAAVYRKIVVAINLHIVNVCPADWLDGYDANGRYPYIFRSR